MAVASSAQAQKADDKAPEDQFRNKQFPSAFECKPCHALQFRQWSASPHAYANLSPVFVAVENQTKDKTNGTSGTTCSRCHAPLAAVLDVMQISNMKRAQFAREGEDFLGPVVEGITCVVCHRFDKRYAKRSARALITEGDIFAPIFGPTNNDIQAETQKDTRLALVTEPGKKGRPIHKRVEHYPFLRASIFCGNCHSSRLPTGFHNEETFDEYRTSPSAVAGVTCQDCHMGKVPGEAKGFDKGPAAVIGKTETKHRRLSNHSMPGPDFSVLHPGIFPHNQDAVKLANYEQWLQFDHEKGWGTDEFEDNVADDHKFPQFWQDQDLRYEARDILDEQFKTLNYANEQRLAVMKAGYKVEDFVVEKANLSDGLKFKIKLRNAVLGHNAPTGFIHERMVFFQITVTDSRGNVVFRSGDRDPNGDLRERPSRYVRAGKLPLDTQLFNLQSHFMVHNFFGGERTQQRTTPFSRTTRPFVRPPINPTAILMRPNGTRTKKSGIEPGGFRWAAYEVDGDKLKAGETYTLHMKLIAQAEPAFFIDVQSSAGVGLDYNFSLRELTKRVVDVSIDIWEQTQSVTIKQEGGV
ncbi:MAG TPA: multiheme c-type cytochrome [Rhodospirillales bacterium]|nr:multiheme c-type cytochrome [Alphaproteobacteria bacterium]HJP55140.1 multiheme c-type cytochrome [Rhodospirillales bacterium]